MRKALLLAKREYRSAVRTKGFILGLIGAPILMSGSLLAMWIMKSHSDTDDQVVAVLDHSGVVAEAIAEAAEVRNTTEIIDEESGEKRKPAYVVRFVEPRPDIAQLRLELSDKVRREQLHAFVEIGRDVVHPEGDDSDTRIAYHSQNASMDDMRRWIAQPINQELRRQRLREAGVSDADMATLFRYVRVEGMGLVSKDEDGRITEARTSSEGEAIGVPLVLIMLMFIMVMMGAMPLLNSVMEEKNQRIAEVLLGSIKPFEFMMGKVLGGIAVSLTASAVYVVTGIVAIRQAGVAEYIPWGILPWFFVYMTLNILMLGATLAALGSACNDAKDAQSLSMPALFPVMIPMFMLGSVLEEPSSSIATTMSLIPPFTPMLMLLRQGTPAGVPAWQPWVGLVGVLLTSALAVWVGSRIFRVGILMQGKSPKLGEMLRWAFGRA